MLLEVLLNSALFFIGLVSSYLDFSTSTLERISDLFMGPFDSIESSKGLLARGNISKIISLNCVMISHKNNRVILLS